MNSMQANVKLSPEELGLVTNAEWILTKNRIIAKVVEMFAGLAERYRPLAAACLPEALRQLPPRISKGERYQNLPYVVLDYPRLFSRDEVCAFRSFFWWGHFFSFTIQVSGTYAAQALPGLQTLAGRGWYRCVGEDPWQHHFEPGNYRLFETGQVLAPGPFIKLAKKIPLTEWNAAESFFTGCFGEACSVISYPGGETGLSPGTPITGSGL